MSTATTQEPAWLADEEPFQPPLEDEGGLHRLGREPMDLADDIEAEADLYDQLNNDTEEAGDDGEDYGGEIELDESTLLHKARQLEEIQEASEQVAEAQKAYESAKKGATARKADFEEAVENLTRLIRASKESLPLFDRPKPAAKEEPAETVEIPAANGWEGVQLSSIAGFPTKVHEELNRQQGIFTLGSLAAWTAADNKLTDLKGIGPAKAEAAKNALEAFWDERYPPKTTEARDEEEAEATRP